MVFFLKSSWFVLNCLGNWLDGIKSTERFLEKLVIFNFTKFLGVFSLKLGGNFDTFWKWLGFFGVLSLTSSLHNYTSPLILLDLITFWMGKYMIGKWHIWWKNLKFMGNHFVIPATRIKSAIGFIFGSP